MDILIANLYKNAATVCQQVFGNNQAVTQIGEVGVDTECPCIAVRPNLLLFAG